MGYPGGKDGAGTYQTIINQIPPHRVYLEPFLGGGAVFRRLARAPVSIGLDLDPEVSSRHKATLADVGSLVALPKGRWVGVGCALDFLERVAPRLDRNCFVYLDPPYLASVRKRQAPIYRYEFAEVEQHERLLAVVQSLRANVALSGYWSRLYDRELSGWRRLDFESSTRAGLATESLWCNYPEPKELHDYRFLGTDRTDRQRIKRKKERFIGKLQRTPARERYAILAALEEWRYRADV